MRKLLIVGLLLLPTWAWANEIPGTRVAGQGAVCGEGEGKALEINATTKQEWSYCFKREVIIATPTLTPTPTSTPTPSATAQPSPTQTTEPQPTQINEPTNEPVSQPTTDSSTATVASSPTVTPTPTPTPTLPSAPVLVERSNVVEVNATTNVTVVREETLEEWFARVLWNWWNWYDQLAMWFASVYGE